MRGHAEHELTVCTVVGDDTGDVSRILRALHVQSAPRGSFDVVVVDATSAGSVTVEDQTGFDVTVVRVPPDRGRAEQLNAAWRTAKAPGVAFIGAELEPASLWVESMSKALARGRPVVIGKMLPHPDSMPLAGRLSYRLWADRREAPLVSADNLAVQRADLERVEGFAADIDDVEACDLDLAARLVDDGCERRWARHAAAFYLVDPRIDLNQMIRDRSRSPESLAVLAERPRARARLLTGGVFWHRRDAEALLAVAGLVAGVRNPRALALTLPWLHERTCLTPRAGGRRRKWFVLPGVFAFDVYDAVVTTTDRLRPPARH